MHKYFINSLLFYIKMQKIIMSYMVRIQYNMRIQGINKIMKFYNILQFSTGRNAC